MSDKKKIYSAEAVANNILWLAKKESKTLTQMQLIKLVYIAYGWVLALLERKLFENRIEAWQHGPVIPEIYNKFQHFGRNPITTFATIPELDKIGEIKGYHYPVIDPSESDVHDVIAAVWDNYKDYDAWKLSDLTHECDSAWHKARNKGDKYPLDDEDIKARSIEGIKKKYALQ